MEFHCRAFRLLRAVSAFPSSTRPPGRDRILVEVAPRLCDNSPDDIASRLAGLKRSRSSLVSAFRDTNEMNRGRINYRTGDGARSPPGRLLGCFNRQLPCSSWQIVLCRGVRLDCSRYFCSYLRESYLQLSLRSRSPHCRKRTPQKRRLTV